MTIADATIPRQVKLVIWDLDETLWAGTLSEGDVHLDAGRIELIRTLNRRGIVSAISSKNDLDPVRERLMEAGAWDDFVFPTVNWNPKGQQIAQIIEEMQLRPDNVLFIDDNPLNLGEAIHFAPNLMTADPSVIDDLLGHPNLAGKPDDELKRLQQYKLLERKAQDRSGSGSSNDEFLRSCDIHIYIAADCGGMSDRLLDLVNRANQLNFTKSRYTPEKFDDLLNDQTIEARYVSVRDRYGDYGVVGFYSTVGDELRDFVFSCRTMNMGIEQWLYDHLGRPRLAVVGDVSSDPFTGAGDWITLDTEESEGGNRPEDTGAQISARILLKGGCDLEAVADMLAADDLVSEVSFVNAQGQYIHMHHTETIKRSEPATLEQYGDIIDRLPFADRAGYSSILRDPDEKFDVVIYSLILDYTQNLYRLKNTDFLVPFEQLHVDVTDSRTWPRVLKQHVVNGVTEESLVWFAEHFEPVGPLTPDQFSANVKWLAESRPDTKFVFLNAPEVPIENQLEPERHLHHKVLNDRLDELVATLPNAVICDLRKIVTSEDDLTLNIRHFNRATYLRIARALPELLGSDLAFVAPTLRKRVRSKLGNLRRRARRLMA